MHWLLPKTLEVVHGKSLHEWRKKSLNLNKKNHTLKETFIQAIDM